MEQRDRQQGGALVRLRLNGAPDVSGVANLNDPKNASEFVKSRQIGELDKLPDLGRLRETRRSSGEPSDG